MLSNNQTYRLFDIHLSEIFNNFTEVVCLIDKRGIVQYFNSAYQNLFGNNNQPIHLFADNFTEDHRVEISNLLEGIFFTQIKEYKFENEFRLKNGKKIWLEFTTTSPTAFEKQSYIFLIIRNITEKKNIEYQLFKK